MFFGVLWDFPVLSYPRRNTQGYRARVIECRALVIKYRALLIKIQSARAVRCCILYRFLIIVTKQYPGLFCAGTKPEDSLKTNSKASRLLCKNVRSVRLL